MILKNNIVAKDNLNNLIKTNYAEYDEKKRTFKSKGTTAIITTEKYLINTKDVILNNENKIISSENETIIEDPDGNLVSLENFEYSAQNNIFKSVGNIKINDEKGNAYQFFTNIY